MHDSGCSETGQGPFSLPQLQGKEAPQYLWLWRKCREETGQDGRRSRAMKHSLPGGMLQVTFP